MILDTNSIAKILALKDFSSYFQQADDIRKENVGDDIKIRALLEFSNYCSRNCSYCGLNCYNKSVKRFRLTEKEIINNVQIAYENGYKTIVLQSGEDKYFTPKILGDIVKEIKKNDIDITLSCGELKFDDYKYLRECGADRYLLKHETSDENIYSNLHKGYTLKQRIDCLKWIKSVGLETGSGFMIGLPNQTLETIANDILLLKELECDMAGIGPFIAHKETELNGSENGSVELTLRAVALARIILPKANLPATTALGVIDIVKKRNIFSCGANVVMQKITPNNVKRLYEIYPSNLVDLTIEQGRKNIEQEIISLGKNPV